MSIEACVSGGRPKGLSSRLLVILPVCGGLKSGVLSVCRPAMGKVRTKLPGRLQRHRFMQRPERRTFMAEANRPSCLRDLCLIVNIRGAAGGMLFGNEGVNVLSRHSPPEHICCFFGKCCKLASRPMKSFSDGVQNLHAVRQVRSRRRGARMARQQYLCCCVIPCIRWCCWLLAALTTSSEPPGYLS